MKFAVGSPERDIGPVSSSIVKQGDHSMASDQIHECPVCKAENSGDASVCCVCGAKLVSEILEEHPPKPEEFLCPECRVALPPGAKTCPACGVDIPG
jgi:hypothetical protein